MVEQPPPVIHLAVRFIQKPKVSIPLQISAIDVILRAW
jgi:hypothetical protein